MTYLIIACAISGVAGLAIGALWYGPLFGKMWMQETGMTEEDAKKGNMPLIFGLSFLICAYFAYEMKWVNHPDENLAPILHGMFHGAKNAGLFAVGALIVNGLFEQKSLRYHLINVGYWLLTFAIIGGITAFTLSMKPVEKKTETETEETGMNIEMILETESLSAVRESRDDTYYL